MFDIGFSEILLIFVIALVVLGPEKLPRVASQVGRWMGRARGMARQFREQLEEEINLEEARKAQSTVTRSPVPEVSPPSVPPVTQTPESGAPAPEQPVYPDAYSHAHPTDYLGRTMPSPDPDAVDPRQQDWVGGPGAQQKPAANASEPPAYAPPNERGT
jgi:sec-independent protein translocase protein TatB